ncbi:hypothetical protein [Mongoliibacter ruber]|nr:hypothetical protein [Mongoliibacter ruber]
MIKSKLIYLMGCLGFIALMTSCQEENDGFRPGDAPAIGIAFKLSSDQTGTNANARVLESAVVIESGYFHVEEISLETEGRTANGRFEKEFEIEYDQPKKITLDRFDENADFFIEIAEGEYEEIEFEFELENANDEPAIFLAGTFTDPDGNSIPLQFEYFDDDFEFEVEIEAAEGEYFQVDRVNNPLFLFEMYPSNWFSGLSSAELENAEITNGVLLINSEVNEALFTKVKRKMKDDAEIEIKM